MNNSLIRAKRFDVSFLIWIDGGFILVSDLKGLDSMKSQTEQKRKQTHENQKCFNQKEKVRATDCLEELTFRATFGRLIDD